MTRNSGGRTRLAKGIYRDASGISAIYRSGGQRIETRWPLDTDVPHLTKWRARQIQQALVFSPRVPRNALARDVVRYLKRLRGRPGYSSEKSHLLAWLHELGATTRRAVTPERCDLIIATWLEAGYAAKTIRHRVRVFRSLYHRLDGRRMPTPLDDVNLPKKTKARRISVADTTIAAVALELRKSELIGRLRDSKTRARFLVLATHAQRPCQVKGTEPHDVDLDRRLWMVPPAKSGEYIELPLNDDQVAAWRLFIAAKAWGKFNSRSFSKTLKRNGWPKHVRPYNLRHSTGVALTKRDVDLGDIQEMMGHASPDTTRQNYVPGQTARLAKAGKTLEGRFNGEPFLPVVKTSKKKAS